MNNVPELKKLMGNAGFHQTTVEIYLFLLLHGLKTIEEIAAEINIDFDIVEKDILVLRDSKLIGVDIEKNNTQYYAINPEITWNAITSREIWKFVRSPQDYIEKRPPHALPQNEMSPFVEHMRNVLYQIRHIAMEIYNDSKVNLRHQWRDVADYDELAQKLAEAILESRTSILSVSKPPRNPNVALIWASIQKKLQDGVPYKRVTNLPEIIEHGLLVVERDINDFGVGIRIMDIADIEHKFYVIDTKFLIVYHQTGISGSDQIGRINRQKETIKRYKERFRFYYDQAVSATFVLNYLRQEADQMCESAAKLGFDQKAINWLRCIVDWGRFCEMKDTEIRDMSALERALQKAGFIKFGTTGHPIINYQSTFKDIHQAWTNNSNGEQNENRRD